jgi:hypothetical protein
MIEVLKILVSKIDGAASVLVTAMILVYLLGIASVVNNLFLCIGVITFLSIFFSVMLFFKRSKNLKNEDKKG